jgi:hypothetical protein
MSVEPAALLAIAGGLGGAGSHGFSAKDIAGQQNSSHTTKNRGDLMVLLPFFNNNENFLQKSYRQKKQHTR